MKKYFINVPFDVRKVINKNYLNYLIYLIILTGFLNGCKENSEIISVNSNNYNVDMVSKQKQNIAANFAKVLAIDLNENDNHRKEIYSKIAVRYDGDLEIKVSDLSNKVLGEIESFSNDLIDNKTLKKSNPGKSFLKTIKQISTADLQSNFQALQIAMPFASKWTDETIQKAGGLVVAYYPFGIDDIKIKDIIGFNKDGKEIIINEKNAPEIPYIILSENEREEMMIQKLKNQVFSRFCSRLNIKGIECSQDNEWMNKNILSLEPEISKIMKEEIRNNLSNKSKKKNSIAIDDTLGEPVDPGDPPGDPSQTPHSWSSNEWLWVKGFEVINVFNYEPYWTNGDPEFLIKFTAVLSGATATNPTVNQLPVPLEEKYNGDNEGIWYPPFVLHHYRGGFVYGDYSMLYNKLSIKGDADIHIGVVEDDTGSPEIKFSYTLPFGKDGGSATGSVTFKDGDDVMGAILMPVSINFPFIAYISDFHLLLNTL